MNDHRRGRCRHGAHARVVVTTTVALGLAACGPVPEEELSCPAWTRAEEGRCILRSWTAASPTIGAAGASDVQVAVGPQSRAMLAWTHASQTAGTIMLAETAEFSDPKAATWSLTEVSAGDGVGVEPAIAMGPEGQALLAWKQQAAEGSVFLATRDLEGAWQMPSSPISWDGNAYEPRVQIGDDGEALVIWNQWAGSVFGVAVGLRAARSSAFSFPEAPEQLLSPPSNYANAPRLALSSTGEALITWYQAPVDDLMVFASERRERASAFGQPAADDFLSPLGGPVDSHPEANPQPALHPSGAAAIVWTQQIDQGSTPVFVATRSPDGQWQRPASVRDSLSDPNAIARCPMVAFDPEGEIVVTWHETRGAVNEVMVWRESGEPQRLSTEGTEAVAPALAMGAQGGALVVWAEQDAQGWRIVARGHQPVEDRWLPATTLSAPSVGLAPRPQLAVDTNDRVLVAWVEGSVVEGRVHTAMLP